ncbi:MAG: hypothetical protein PHH48_06525 [Eubacteriales bacterium]|nr:hypothetical protein [Eubacteriales bacterium]
MKLFSKKQKAPEQPTEPPKPVYHVYPDCVKQYNEINNKLKSLNRIPVYLSEHISSLFDNLEKYIDLRERGHNINHNFESMDYIISKTDKELKSKWEEYYSTLESIDILNEELKNLEEEAKNIGWEITYSVFGMPYWVKVEK